MTDVGAGANSAQLAEITLDRAENSPHYVRSFCGD